MKNKLIFPTLNAAETKWDHMKVNNSSKNLFYQEQHPPLTPP